MNQEELIVLTNKILSREASAEEIRTYNAWYNAQQQQSEHIIPNAETKGRELYARIEERIERDDAATKLHRNSLWSGFTLSRIAAAAAVLLVIGAGLFFYTSYYTPRHLEGSAATRDLNNDIKPGGNKAYLTLANGKKLSLSDATNGALAKEAGVEISKTADGQVVYKGLDPVSKYSNAVNTIETPKGGQYQVRLPDGSKVWLNAASKLTYPVSFNGREDRKVELSGEAYFEVAKDKVHPFKVKSNGQEVEVLGTHFNINSYVDEASTKTTLLEGSVKVTTSSLLSTPSLPTSSLRGGTTKQPHTSEETILKPGQQSILEGGKINVVLADLDETMAWQKGDFVFKNEPLESIMKKISRWYDVEIVYAEGAPKNITLVGLVSCSRNLSAVLKMMEMTKKVKFKVEGKKVTVLPVKPSLANAQKQR